jgi:hypothetical protein
MFNVDKLVKSQIPMAKKKRKRMQTRNTPKKINLDQGDYLDYTPIKSYYLWSKIL